MKCLPCINHGYAHAASVQCRGESWRKPRLVKGAHRETCITGKNYICKLCETEYHAVKRNLQEVEERLHNITVRLKELNPQELEQHAAEKRAKKARDHRDKRAAKRQRTEGPRAASSRADDSSEH